MIETIDKLIEFAKSRRYTQANIDLLMSAYEIARKYSENKFRFRKPSRPFLNHLVSTCAILMTTCMNIETVVAGLLHSVKDEIPKVHLKVPLEPTVIQTNWSSQIYSLNKTVGEIVDNYFDLSIGNPEQIAFDKVTNIQAAIMAIQLANTTDMILAGEYKT